MVNGVRDAPERIRRLHGNDYVLSSDIVEKALVRCKGEITSMKDIIDEYNNKNASRNLFKGVGASAELVSKKKRLMEYERRIQRSISAFEYCRNV